jgi:NADPH:quinone reductase
MRYVEHGSGGDATVMRVGDTEMPKVATGEVLIRVAYAGVNRPDVLQRSGRYPAPKDASPVLGLEVSGTIEAVGEGVTGWATGDAVCALTPGGGYAEYCVAPAGHCLPIPRGLGLREAAALPETVMTVWANVFMLGRLAAGESFLVHGGASGIGYTATQIARARGAKVYATVGHADKLAFCLAHGAHAVCQYDQTDWLTWLLDQTAGQGVDVILDMVGGEYVAKNLRALALEGRLMQIAFLRGAKVEIDATAIMMKRLTWGGSTLRARSVAAKCAIVDAVRKDVWPIIERGEFKVVIDRTFDLDQVVDAHRLMESNQHLGKIVLAVAAAP